MIGLDTVVLLRYFAQDDPIQSVKATRLIERRLTKNEPGFISLVALMETMWVLSNRYEMDRIALAEVLERMLRTDKFALQNENEVFRAFSLFTEGKGSFADALIGSLGQWSGCDSVVTFDKGASRLEGFKLL